MNRLHLTVAAAALALAAGAVAQSQNLVPPRPEVRLSGNVQTTSIAGFNAWKVASSPVRLPGDAARGLTDTARTVFAVWVDEAPNQDLTIRVAKSVDGGWSWDPAAQQDVLIADFFNFERFVGQDIQLVVDGYNVFVGVRFNRDSQGGSQRDSFPWIVASNDQGQTWQSIIASVGQEAPLSTGDDLGGIGELRIAAANGRCHVAFNCDYDNARGFNGPSVLEDTFYQAVEFDQNGNLVRVYNEEKRMEQGRSGTVDSDNPEIAASGNNVIVSWQDDRFSIVNGQYQPSPQSLETFVRVSNNGGSSFRNEHNATEFDANQEIPMPLIRRSKVAADGNNLYSFQEDHRFASVDQVYMSVSNDGGATWVNRTKVSLSPLQVDSDGMHVVAKDGTVAVAYADDRNGQGNVDNDIYVVIDRNAGADFVAGTHGELIAVDNQGNDQIFGLDFYDDTYAVVGEFVLTSGEGCGYAISSDFGQTWTSFLCEDGRGEDVDDPAMTLTLNRDFAMIWQDDAGRGNNNNVVYTRGGKFPYLVDDTANGNGILYRGISQFDVQDVVILLVSATPPSSNGLDPLGTGDLVNFTADSLTFGALTSSIFYLPSVPQGGGDWLSQLPQPIQRLSTLIGTRLWYAGFAVDLNPVAPTSGFTDPIEQRQ